MWMWNSRVVVFSFSLMLVVEALAQEPQALKPTGDKPTSQPTEIPQTLSPTRIEWSPTTVAEPATTENKPEAIKQSPTINLGGRFDFDSAFYRPDPQLHFGNSDTTKLQDGAAIRRLHVRVFGDVMPWMSYVAELNFTNISEFARDNTRDQIQSLGLGDTYLTLRNPAILGEAGEVRIGHVQEPFSLERMSSANALFFLERSPVFDALLNPVDYSDGAVYSTTCFDERATFAFSAARVGATVNPFGFGAGDGMYGASARVTALPVYRNNGETLVHVGAGVLHRAVEPESSNIGSRLLVRGGAGASQTPNIIQTQDVFVRNGISMFGLEGAMVFGRLSVSCEGMLAVARGMYEEYDGVTFTKPRGNGVIPGAYVELGYFLTPGMRRRYDRRYGVWDRPQVADPAMSRRPGESGWRLGTGAWEVVARYSYLDLQSPNPVRLRPDGAQPGTEHDITLGFVWHVNTYSRFMGNYVFTRIDSASSTSSGDIHSIGFRMHIDF